MGTDEEEDGMDDLETRFDDVTKRIIGCVYKVANALGAVFLEKVYENALAHEPRKTGFAVEQQIPLNVWYDGIIVGEFVADLIVEKTILIELKAISELAKIHSAQCINYLAATHLPVCLLINFSDRVQVKRLAGPTLRQSD